MRLELTLFLACLALAVAIAHVAITCRDRGTISHVTLLVGAGRAVMLVRKLVMSFPFRAAVSA
jgi:hypothetical protein